MKRFTKLLIPVAFFVLIFISLGPVIAGSGDGSEKSPVPETVRGGSKNSSIPEYSDFSDLGGKTVSMLTGAPFEELVRSKVPDVGDFSFFSNTADIILALKSHKTDALLTNNAIAQLAVNRDPEIALFPQDLQSGVFGFAFAKDGPGRDQWQAAYDAIGEDEIKAAWEKWTGADDSLKKLPEQDWPGLNGTVKAAVCDTLEPMSYVGANGQTMGFDNELILLMAKQLDVHVDFIGMEFSAILASVQSGKALLGAGSIIISEERKEAVDFVPYYPAAFVLVVRSAQNQKTDTPVSADMRSGLSLDDMNGKRIGVQTGTSFDEMIRNRLPDAKILYYNNKADLINALMTGKIDGYAIDEPVAVLELHENDNITYIPEYLDTFDYSFIFPKDDDGEDWRREFNQFLEEIISDGTIAEIQKKWLSGDKSFWTMDDYKSLPALNGMLYLATEPLYEPFAFIYNAAIMGYEIDLVSRFCKASGYGLSVVSMNFDSILPSIQTKKADMGAGGITVNEERAENVLFSDSYYNGGTVIIVLKEERSADPGEPSASQPSAGNKSGSNGIKDSFEKTFIRESRWKLFLEGIRNTLLITVLSILFGTALGFVLFMLFRKGNSAAEWISGKCMWLVQGMPGVVLLMILYYIVFGSVDISGIVVSVIGFTLTFGSAVFGLLKIGVGAVDAGQYEAAYALGYSDTRTFFRFILPQAIPHVADAYKGEIIGLLKATAIVGYIAVQDLTKMGDIIRSRTYEAFFPLIAVTIFYFLLEMLLGSFVGKLKGNMDPRSRSQETILKGVDTHEQN